MSHTVLQRIFRYFEKAYSNAEFNIFHVLSAKLIEQFVVVFLIKVVNKIADDKGFIDVYPGMDVAEQAGFFLRRKYRLFDKIMFSKVREMMGGNVVFACSAAGSLSPDLFKLFLAMGFNLLYLNFPPSEDSF